MIFLLAGIPIIGLLIFFVFDLRSIAGALLLGFSAVSADLLWQWLRLSFNKKFNSGAWIGLILAGFIMRIFSIIFFLKLADHFLTQYDFYIMALTLLLILFTQKIIALMNKWKKDERTDA